MNNTITVPATKLDEILKLLIHVKEEVSRLTERIEELEPTYGSDAWWNWSDKKATLDIKAGRFVELKNKKELQVYLDSLKSA